MKESVILKDGKYISARQAAGIFGYTADYIGQLCRAGKLDAKMIGRSWFVTEESIIKYRLSVSVELANEVLETVQDPVLPISYNPKLILSAGLCIISIFFVFRSIYIHTDVMNNASKNPMTASVISASENLAHEIFDLLYRLPKLAVDFFSQRGSINISDAKKSEIEFNGMAVVPSSNSASKDEAIKNRIRNSFSDEVIVNPDASGNAGIITPVFRQAKGDDFLYVIVPVNSNNQ